MSEILDRARQAAEARRERQRRLLDLLRQVESRMQREGEARAALEAQVASLGFERDEAQAALSQAADERDRARADLSRARAERDEALADAAALRATVARLEASLGELVDLIEDDAEAHDPIVTLEALLRGDVPAGLGHNSTGHAAPHAAAPDTAAPDTIAPDTADDDAAEVEAPPPAEVSDDGQVFSDASLVQFEAEDEPVPPEAVLAEDDAEAPPQDVMPEETSSDEIAPHETSPHGSPGHGAALDPDAERRLRVLEDFLEQGLVTQEEYDRRRRELTRTAQTF